MKWSRNWFLLFLLLVMISSIYGLFFINNAKKADIISKSLLNVVGFCVLYGLIGFAPRFQLKFIEKDNKRYFIYLKGLKSFAYILIILSSIGVLSASFKILLSNETYNLLFIGPPFGFILGGFSLLNYVKAKND